MSSEKISIIEGGIPEFEPVEDQWVRDITNSLNMPGFEPRLVRLRSHNAAELRERCHRTWRQKDQIYLHYQDRIGSLSAAMIISARDVMFGDDTEGILLWVMMNEEMLGMV
jgi:hypothetical protein